MQRLVPVGYSPPAHWTPRKQVPHAVRFSGDSAEYRPRIQRIDHISANSQLKPTLIDNAISRLKPGEKIIIGKSKEKLEEAMLEDRTIVLGFRTTSKDRRISGLHLKIERRGNGLYATDLGTTNGTQHFPVVGEPAPLISHQEKEVKPGEALQICDSRFKITIRPFSNVVEIQHVDRTDQNPGQPITEALTVLQPGQKILIGRNGAELNTLLDKNTGFHSAFQPCVSDKSISRVHLIVERRKAGFYLFDLNTSAGTCIKSGQTLSEPIPPYEYTATLAGDKVYLGHRGMYFIIPEISKMDSGLIRRN